MDHDTVFALKALTAPQRLRIAGRLTGGSATSSALAAELGLAVTIVRRHLSLLVTAGLVERVGSGVDARYAIRLDALARLGRELADMETGRPTATAGPGVGPGGEAIPAEDARVLRGFFADDRLVAIPVQHAKRLVVLRYLRDRCFAEDRPYPEKEVNQRLALFHPDVAALRRYMVDDGVMTRAGGVYRRPA
jgi:DNA-binding transcriptional ArsR family regulator